MPRVEAEERLPPLRPEVLDVVSLVENHVVPRLAAKDMLVREDELVGGHADVKRVLAVPASALLLALLLGPVVGENLEAG